MSIDMGTATDSVEAEFPHDPHGPGWGNPPWPEWITGFRDHQKVAMAEVVEHFKAGVDVVLVDAPTGSGKTILAEGVRRLMNVRRSVYVANTNGLLDQFEQDFGYARPLKGKVNYPTLDKPRLFHGPVWQRVTCGDCDMRRTAEGKRVCSHCSVVTNCPYRVAKNIAVTAQLSVTNTAYLLAECNGPARYVSQIVKGVKIPDPIPFVIVDEADTLESIVMGAMELAIPKKWMEKLRIYPPDLKTVKSSWVEWFDKVAYPKAKLHLRIWDKREEDLANGGGAEMSPEEVKERDYVTRLCQTIIEIGEHIKADNVVYDGYDKGDLRFRLVKVNAVMKKKVWDHAHKWMLMSATIIDPQEFVESLGIEEAGLTWAIVKVPSTFPPENRPIHIKPVANMTNKEAEDEWPKMVAAIDKVLTKHPDDRTLVHTVSYKLATYLKLELEKAGVHRPMMVYSNAKEREKTLKKFRTTEGAVLFAPSMDRGVDLPEDDCRVVIVAKMPFLNLGDKMINARLYSKGGQLWYSVQTVRTLVQMTGRGVRSSTDTCDTYLLDRQFMSNVWAKSRRLLPEWWTDAIDWSGGGV